MTPTMMHAIRVHTPGGPDAMRDEMIPIPEPGPGEVLIKIHAAGVNFIDTYQRAGAYQVPLPVTLGQEAAGTVVRTGDGVTGFASGDRVAYQAILGAYAEYAVVAAQHVVPIPDSVTFEQAAAVMLQGITAHYLATSTYALQPGDTCLIHAAAGGVGLLFCQIATMRGARVIGTVSTGEKAALAREAGAQHVVNYTTHDFVSEVQRITDGRGVDVVYDSVGRTTFDGSLRCLRPRGLLALFGQSSGPVEPFDPQRLSRGGSLYLTRPTVWHYVATRDELLARTSELFSWIGEGRLHVRIGATYPLRAVAEAHRALEGRATTGKVLLLVQGG